MMTQTVLVLSENEYDLYTLNDLWQELEPVVVEGDVTLDFRNVRYIDGASLGVLVKYAKAVKRVSDSRVRIVRASRLIGRILQMACLDRVFDIARPAA